MRKNKFFQILTLDNGKYTDKIKRMVDFSRKKCDFSFWKIKYPGSFTAKSLSFINFSRSIRDLL